MTRVTDIDPLDPDDLTRAEIEARAQAMRLVRVLSRARSGVRERAAGGDRDADRDTRIAPHRRRLHAHAPTTSCARRTFDDAVARSAYPIDIHNPSGSGTTTHRLPPGTAYEIPYRCLVPAAVDGLLVAGRCISTTHEALASTRLTPTVMTLGQAAGTAAALAVEQRVQPRAVDARVLRERLIAAGVDLDRD